MTMRPELQAIIDDFERASERLLVLARAVPDEAWSRRPQTDRWSIAECVAHLNLTGQEFVPLLEGAIARGRTRTDRVPARYRRDPVGWLLWLTIGPPVRFRVRTAASFVPTSTSPASKLVSEFQRLQDAQIDCVREAEGLPLQAIRVQSPFDPRARYNLYSALSILPRHQHRHLWQAEQVLAVL